MKRYLPRENDCAIDPTVGRRISRMEERYGTPPFATVWLRTDRCGIAFDAALPKMEQVISGLDEDLKATGSLSVTRIGAPDGCEFHSAPSLRVLPIKTRIWIFKLLRCCGL